MPEHPTSIVIGTGAKAYAGGWFGTAIAIGENTVAEAGALPDGAGGIPATEVGNLAVAFGSSPGRVIAQAFGVGNVALQVFSTSSVDGGSFAEAEGNGNFAANLFSSYNGTGSVNAALTNGSFNAAVNFFSRGSAALAGRTLDQYSGNLNLALNVGVSTSLVTAAGPISANVNLFGNNIKIGRTSTISAAASTAGTKTATRQATLKLWARKAH
ncbi:hypothetical protein MHPYR_20232 [uncultured Mycobacterium sp.]|uniref:Uncharacterized protein n=1 Tax=uncultured Mycobacterium sp. TaxID=171292 RepID=A0A1Y5P7Y3_9MYCO|nr:hypothetical protein MHPYR_20232 [uncultured Mycobacterium sp.]